MKTQQIVLCLFLDEIDVKPASLEHDDGDLMKKKEDFVDVKIFLTTLQVFNR